MKKLPALPPHVADCCATLWQTGHRACPVGGCVRDLLLGRAPQDWDVTTSARPEDIMALFPRTAFTGGVHGTVTVLTEGGPIEVTPFRAEGGYSDGRHPDRVVFGVSLEEDLARRDFTVNAMALDENGQIIDLFGGQADLEGQLIRCVGSPDRRFSEDALRMFRAVRFAAQLGFELTGDTAAAIRRNAPLAARLSAERITAELDKVLCSPRPGWAAALFKLGLLAPWTAGPTGPAIPLARLPAEPLLRWAGFLALLPDAEALLRHLTLPNRLTRPLQNGLALYGEGLPETDAQWRHALARFGPEGCRAGAAMGGPEPLARLTAVLEGQPCVSVRQLALSGADLAALGLSGPAIGTAQARLLAHVLDHPEGNSPERLRELLK